MAEIIELFKKKDEEPASEKDSKREDLPGYFPCLNDFFALKEGIEPEKMDLIRNLKGSCGISESSLNGARALVGKYSKEELISMINKSSDILIRSKPAFFIAAYEKVISREE
ncbi:MAG: hypothetical protein WC435_02600 [Candidatus Paceibacterota bacterium]